MLLLQKALHKVEKVTLRQWDDAITVGELKEKYKRAYWLKCAEDEAISLHHDQRSRGTVPSYGQALAMANLMEQMHLEVRGMSTSPRAHKSSQNFYQISQKTILDEPSLAAVLSEVKVTSMTVQSGL